jgi:hypothetical protein
MGRAGDLGSADRVVTKDETQKTLLPLAYASIIPLKIPGRASQVRAALSLDLLGSLRAARAGYCNGGKIMTRWPSPSAT